MAMERIAARDFEGEKVGFDTLSPEAYVVCPFHHTKIDIPTGYVIRISCDDCGVTLKYGYCKRCLEFEMLFCRYCRKCYCDLCAVTHEHPQHVVRMKGLGM